MQDINIPIIGGRGLMSLVSLAHILLVSVAGTGPLMANLIEGVGLRRGDDRYMRVSKALVTSVLELAVAGGVLGSGIVVVLIGLYPPAITMLANIFFWFLVLQLICFIGGLAFLFTYCYTFGRSQCMIPFSTVGSLEPSLRYCPRRLPSDWTSRPKSDCTMRSLIADWSRSTAIT